MSVFAGIRRRWDLRPNRPLNLAGFPAQAGGVVRGNRAAGGSRTA
jgi:hypothetical protein